MADFPRDPHPEGATHKERREKQIFYRFESGRWEFFNHADGWVASETWHGKTNTPDSFEPIYPEWDGKGLPPIGCVCEVSIYAGKWEECLIIAHDRGQAIYRHYEDNGNTYYAASREGTPYLRPILTAEQLEAARIREAAIEEMVAHILTDNILSNCADLYDAGYRKQKALTLVDEERSEILKDLVELIETADANDKTMAEAIYYAGYRKQET